MKEHDPDKIVILTQAVALVPKALVPAKHVFPQVKKRAELISYL